SRPFSWYTHPMNSRLGLNGDISSDDCWVSDAGASSGRSGSASGEVGTPHYPTDPAARQYDNPVFRRAGPGPIGRVRAARRPDARMTRCDRPSIHRPTRRPTFVQPVRVRFAETDAM